MRVGDLAPQSVGDRQEVWSVVLACDDQRRNAYLIESPDGHRLQCLLAGVGLGQLELERAALHRPHKGDRIGRDRGSSGMLDPHPNVHVVGVIEISTFERLILGVPESLKLVGPVVVAVHGRVDERQCLNAVGISQGCVEGDGSAHRRANERGAVDRERVQQRHQVAVVSKRAGASRVSPKPRMS